MLDPTITRTTYVPAYVWTNCVKLWSTSFVRWKWDKIEEIHTRFFFMSDTLACFTWDDEGLDETVREDEDEHL
jgi:hypothetical protein